MHSVPLPLNFVQVHHQCNPCNGTRNTSNSFTCIHSFVKTSRWNQEDERHSPVTSVRRVLGLDRYRCTYHIRIITQETQPSETVRNFCNKPVSTKSNLKAHIALIHMAEQKFECDVCRKSFSSKKYKNSHTRQHHGVAAVNTGVGTETFYGCRT